MGGGGEEHTLPLGVQPLSIINHGQCTSRGLESELMLNELRLFFSSSFQRIINQVPPIGYPRNQIRGVGVVYFFSSLSSKTTAHSIQKRSHKVNMNPFQE